MITRRRVARTLIGVLACASASFSPTAYASATQAQTGAATAGDAPVLGPALGIFQFGSSVGLPLACNTATGAVAAGVTEANFTEQARPLIDALNGLSASCSDAGVQGGEQVVSLRTSLAALSSLTPGVNQLLEAIAAGSDSVNETFGPAIAPFGPTFADFAAIVRYFKGS